MQAYSPTLSTSSRDAFLLGTPETSLRGRNTRKALNALTSNPSFISIANTVLIILRTIKHRESLQFDDVVKDYLIDRNATRVPSYGVIKTKQVDTDT